MTTKHATIIGQNLKRMRRDLKLSQETLGHKLGVTFQQIQKYEQGANRISADTLYELRRIFGCSYDDFFIGLTPGDITTDYKSQIVTQVMAKVQQALGVAA